AADLLVAADDRVDLALARYVGEVAAELRQRLVLRLGVRVGDARAAAHRRERLEDRLAIRADLVQRATGGIAFLCGDREQQMLGRDVFVLELLGLFERRLEHARSRARELGLGAAGDLGKRTQRPLELALEPLDRDPELLEHGDRTSLGLGEQRAQQV